MFGRNGDDLDHTIVFQSLRQVRLSDGLKREPALHHWGLSYA